ncbi:MAG: transglutaminase domain-containing protein [Ignavibacteriales bacterium]|nr:transglutaminase domain-containing protein [Ignavibacteriales bacterium]
MRPKSFVILAGLAALLVATTASGQTTLIKVRAMADEGKFTMAERAIDSALSATNANALERLALEFEKARLERVRLDFTVSHEEAKELLREYYPDVTDEQMAAWVERGKLEAMEIDGETWYFNRGVPNLFRVDAEAKEVKRAKDGYDVGARQKFLNDYIPEIVSRTPKSGAPSVLAKPKKVTFDYTVTLQADAVPDGETVRGWFPYPREGHARQTDIRLLSSSEEEYVIASNDNLQRTIYMQKRARAGEPTVFNYKVSYTARAEWFPLDFERDYDYDETSDLYKQFTAERAPHIVFTDEIVALSEKIVGDETRPLMKAKKIYSWISENIPWAGAREYSTIRNLSQYCATKGYGDCGIQTLLFMTLARHNGIPTKWQSGWMLFPMEVNLHDWAEMYVPDIGWVPVDQSFQLQPADDEAHKLFYLGGIDGYRLIANDDYSTPLFPLKIYPRSETVDFQRGELEWRGGNLYFDKWSYWMDVEFEELEEEK